MVASPPDEMAPFDRQPSVVSESDSGTDTNDDDDDDNDNIPDDYLCPLTLELMADPLMSRYGHSYERSAIMEWMNRGNQVCPLTKKPLTASRLLPNERLRLEIVEWRISNGYQVPQRQDSRDYYKQLSAEEAANEGGRSNPATSQVSGILIVPTSRPKRGILHRLQRYFR